MSASAQAPLGPGCSGVYRMPDDGGPLRRLATRAGLAWLPVDLAVVVEKVGFLAACAEQLAFPRGFGRNWDALADCLEDFSWRPETGYVIHLQNTAVFAVAAAADWRTAIEILSHAATYWKERDKTFLVLVEGVPDLPEFDA